MKINHHKVEISQNGFIKVKKLRIQNNQTTMKTETKILMIKLKNL